LKRTFSKAHKGKRETVQRNGKTVGEGTSSEVICVGLPKLDEPCPEDHQHLPRVGEGDCRWAAAGKGGQY